MVRVQSFQRRGGSSRGIHYSSPSMVQHLLNFMSPLQNCCASSSQTHPPCFTRIWCRDCMRVLERSADPQCLPRKDALKTDYTRFSTNILWKLQFRQASDVRIADRILPTVVGFSFRINEIPLQWLFLHENVIACSSGTYVSSPTVQGNSHPTNSTTPWRCCAAGGIGRFKSKIRQ